jgi:hypothetical protein
MGEAWFRPGMATSRASADDTKTRSCWEMKCGQLLNFNRLQVGGDMFWKTQCPQKLAATRGPRTSSQSQRNGPPWRRSQLRGRHLRPRTCMSCALEGAGGGDDAKMFNSDNTRQRARLTATTCRSMARCVSTSATSRPSWHWRWASGAASETLGSWVRNTNHRRIP